jgi:hypothetical protein
MRGGGDLNDFTAVFMASMVVMVLWLILFVLSFLKIRNIERTVGEKQWN